MNNNGFNNSYIYIQIKSNLTRFQFQICSILAKLNNKENRNENYIYFK